MHCIKGYLLDLASKALSCPKVGGKTSESGIRALSRRVFEDASMSVEDDMPPPALRVRGRSAGPSRKAGEVKLREGVSAARIEASSLLRRPGG